MNTTPPHDMSTEKQVLGAILKSRSALDEVAEVLPAATVFYLSKHREIYQAVLKLYERGEPVDVEMVASILGTDSLADAGGRTYLVDLAESVGSTVNAKAHARIVKDKATLRYAITVGQQIIDEAGSDSAEPQNVIEWLDKALLEMSELGERKPSMSLAELSDKFAEPVLSGEPAYRRDDYLLTRVEDLNNRIVGFFRGDLIVVCAPPSGGKTSFALDVGLYNATITNKHVVYYAIDETQLSIVQRLYCSSTGLPRWRFADNRWTNDELDAIEKTHDTLKSIGQRFHIADNLRRLTDIRTHARRHKRQHGLDLIVIDYLQQVSPPTGKRFENRNLELAEIVRQLKELAKELHIPVVVASQYSRKYEVDAEKIRRGVYPRPQITWLRDSGSIEQEANLVIGMFVPGFIVKAALGPDDEKTKAEFDKNGLGILDAELVIMKNKMGETGSVACKFSGPRMQFFSPYVAPEPLPAATDDLGVTLL